MGLTRTEIYTDAQNQFAKRLKALAHPARIAILQYLMKQTTCIGNDLVEELGLAQSTISQHLRELKKIGIVKGEVEGTSKCYCIDQQVWKELKQDLNLFFRDYELVEDCC